VLHALRVLLYGSRSDLLFNFSIFSIFQFFFAYGCAHSQEKPKSQFSFRYRIPRYGESQEEVFFFVKNQGNGPQSHNPTVPHIFFVG
jgi:hypothetical protein